MLRRLVEMLRALGRGWRTLPDLALGLGVHRRTVYRMLAAVREAGIPVSRRVRRDGRIEYRVRGRWWA